MSTFMDSILTTQYELHRQILEVIALIPYGKVATYGQVARMAGLPKHARLVGMCLNILRQIIRSLGIVLLIRKVKLA